MSAKGDRMSDFLKTVALPIEAWLATCQDGESLKVIKTDGLTLLQRQSDLQVYIITVRQGERDEG